MRVIIFHSDADAEVVEAARYYEVRSSGLGSDLLEEIQRSLTQIAIDPEMYRQVGRRVRRKPLRRFPYNLIYLVYPDQIRIVAFAHQKRRPFYWQKRLQDSI